MQQFTDENETWQITYFGRYGDNQATEGAELGSSAWRQRLIQLSMSANVAANMARGNATISLVMFLFRSLTVRHLSNNLFFMRPQRKESGTVMSVDQVGQVLSGNPIPKETLDFFRGSIRCNMSHYVENS
jgi:hypothetical protein